MGKFVNSRRKNVSSLGDTDITQKSDINERLSKLMEEQRAEHTESEITAASEEQSSVEISNDLENINRVIGDPDNEFVARDKMDFAPEEWNCFPKASEADIEKMAASIHKYGLLHRVTVWKRPDGRYTILGGHTRTACYDYLYKTTEEDRYQYVPCLVYKEDQLTEVDAHRIFLLSNTDQRAMSASVLVKAYTNLVELEKKQAFYGSGIYARAAAAKQANVSKTMLGRYLKLQDLIPELMNAVDTRQLPVKSAYYLAFLKTNLQQYIAEKKYYENLPERTAKRLENEAVYKKDIDSIIKNENSENVFRYTVELKTEKPDGFDIAPLILPVDEESRNIIIESLSNAINKMDISNKMKKILLDGIFQE